jgi:hypothetical protein
VSAKHRHKECLPSARKSRTVLSNLTTGRVCEGLHRVCLVPYRQWPYSGLIPHVRGPTDSVRFIVSISFWIGRGQSIWSANNISQVQVQVTLRPTVSRPVCLGVGPSFRAHDQIFIIVGHLRSSCWGAPSLTRGRVCNLLVQFAVTLRSKSCRTRDILLCHLTLPHLEGQVPVSTTPRNRVAQLYPGHWLYYFGSSSNSTNNKNTFTYTHYHFMGYYVPWALSGTVQ